jgi:hypothetical protein
LTFNQGGLGGRTGLSAGADSGFGLMDDWMFDNFPVYQTRENRKGLVFELAFALHAPPHALAGLSFLHPLSLPGLEVHRVFLNLLDDRFLLDPSLEAPESALDGFSFVNNDKSQ